jgi:hypothetical protein
MVSDTAIPEFFVGHPKLAILIAATCLFVSLCMIARLWVVHSTASLIKKVAWSIVLFVPALGWIFYGAFFRAPSVSGNRAPEEHSRDAYTAIGDYPPHI